MLLCILLSILLCILLSILLSRMLCLLLCIRLSILLSILLSIMLCKVPQWKKRLTKFHGGRKDLLSSTMEEAAYVEKRPQLNQPGSPYAGQGPLFMYPDHGHSWGPLLVGQAQGWIQSNCSRFGDAVRTVESASTQTGSLG